MLLCFNPLVNQRCYCTTSKRDSWYSFQSASLASQRCYLAIRSTSGPSQCFNPPPWLTSEAIRICQATYLQHSRFNPSSLAQRASANLAQQNRAGWVSMNVSGFLALGIEEIIEFQPSSLVHQRCYPPGPRPGRVPSPPFQSSSLAIQGCHRRLLSSHYPR